MPRQRAYFATEKGQCHLWRKRSHAETRLQLQLQPQGKGTMTSEDKARIQRDLNSQLIRLGRTREYTAPVAVQLDFTVTQANPPAIHTLVKNYLDVLQDVEPSAGVGRRKLLLRDDRQVRLLSCNYRLGQRRDKPELWIRVASMSDLAADLELYERIRHGNFADEPGLHGRTSWHLRNREDPEEPTERDSDALEDLRRWEKDEHRIVSRFGRKAFEAMRFMCKSQAQEQLLETWRLRPGHLRMLLSGDARRSRSRTKSFYAATVGPLRNLLLRSPLSFGLAAPAVQHGETKTFKQSVREAIAKLRGKPLLYPLLMPIGITIIYIPPRKGQELDLDNLARRVVPSFHDELKPPSDLIHVLAIDDMTDPGTKRYFIARRADLARLPKIHVASYQALRVPRAAADPVKGDVRLLIHGAGPRSNVWDSMDRVLSDWARDLE